LAPPAYPDTASLTPFTCWNTAWTPQKQPPASTTFSCAAAESAASPSAGAGSATAGSAECAPASVKANAPTTKATQTAPPSGPAIELGLNMALLLFRIVARRWCVRAAFP
jgi:hypothetical protein